MTASNFQNLLNVTDNLVQHANNPLLFFNEEERTKLGTNDIKGLKKEDKIKLAARINEFVNENQSAFSQVVDQNLVSKSLTQLQEIVGSLDPKEMDPSIKARIEKAQKESIGYLHEIPGDILKIVAENNASTLVTLGRTAKNLLPLAEWSKNPAVRAKALSGPIIELYLTSAEAIEMMCDPAVAPLIKNVDLRNCNGINNVLLRKLAQDCHHIEELLLPESPAYDDTGILEFKNHSKLHTLKIGHSEVEELLTNIDLEHDFPEISKVEGTFLTTPGSFPALQHIDLMRTALLSNDNAKKIFQRKNLKSVCLNLQQNFQLPSLGTEAPKLETIKLKGRGTTEQILQGLLRNNSSTLETLNIPLTNQLITTLATCAKLKSLTLQYTSNPLTVDNLRSVVMGCPNLRRVNLRNGNIKNVSKIPAILSSLKELEVLVLGDVFTQSIKANLIFPKLKTFDGDPYDVHLDQQNVLNGLKKLISACPRLESLNNLTISVTNAKKNLAGSFNEALKLFGKSMNKINIWGDEDLELIEQVAKNCPNITTIEFEQPWKGDDAIKIMAQHCPHVTSIIVEQPIPLTDIFLDTISTTWPGLQKLELFSRARSHDASPNFTVEQLDRFAEKCHHLQILKLLSPSFTDEMLLAMIPKLKKLRELELHYTNITDQTLNVIATSCPDLEKIKITYCGNTTVLGFESLQATCQGLKQAYYS